MVKILNMNYNFDRIRLIQEKNIIAKNTFPGLISISIQSTLLFAMLSVNIFCIKIGQHYFRSGNSLKNKLSGN